MASGHRTGASPLPPDAEGLVLLGGGWIWEGNVRPVLEMLTLYTGGGLDADEWSSVEERVAISDSRDPDGWCVHPVAGGADRLVVVLARAVDEGIVVVRVWGDDRSALLDRIETLIDIGNMYRLTPPGV